MTYEEYRAATPWERFKYRAYRNPIILFVFGPLFTFVITNRWAGWGGTKAQTRSILLTDLGLVVVGTVISLLFGFKTYLAVQLPIILISGSMGIWLFYIQHQFDPGYWARDEKWDKYDAAMYGASYYKLPAVLRWFSGNIGVHHLHHLQPRIPNYRLYRAYRELPGAQIPEPLTVWGSLKSVRVNLWSEVQEKFLSFRQATRLLRGDGQRAS
jgi:omega-6 fatty acid desaturase (delta-12 desaturase)